MSKNPLGEVFGFPIQNISDRAINFRKSKLCPYNNISPNCTKDKADNPLGVCSIYDNTEIAITCPVRFRQDWIIATDAATFFFDDNVTWTSLSEVRLNDAKGKSAGNIDLVLVAYDKDGIISDFGAVEIQGVYISGNIRRPFEEYMGNMPSDFNWDVNYNYPKADYLSSSRKRLVPQLMFKGGILNTWGKKMCVVLHETFFNTLPSLPCVSKEEADIAWLIYNLDFSESQCCYNLRKSRVVYTRFSDALDTITVPISGRIEDFVGHLQEKLNQKIETEAPPETINPMDLLIK